MNELTINIEGYGKVVIERPDVLSEDSFDDAVADVVVKVCQLLKPNTQSKRFHPALGYGGYS